MTGTEGSLTDFQLQVARLFFSSPEAKGFLLAGGAGLIVQNLTSLELEHFRAFFEGWAVEIRSP